MPRIGRVVIPNYPHHVVQRGHNRQVVFADARDFEYYLSDLRELKEALGVRVYAYCLMTNHVHLLLSPGDTPTSLGQLMKALVARMTRYRNKLEGRSGTLWESRYKSSVVQSDTYLLACSRYIELNPVRAHIVSRAENYPWSSYRLRIVEQAENNWLDIDPCFEALGTTELVRRDRYKEFVAQVAPSGELDLIRSSLQRGQLTGASRFAEEIEQITGLRILGRGRGRPAKKSRYELARWSEAALFNAKINLSPFLSPFLSQNKSVPISFENEENGVMLYLRQIRRGLRSRTQPRGLGYCYRRQARESCRQYLRQTYQFC